VPEMATLQLRSLGMRRQSIILRDIHTSAESCRENGAEADIMVGT
jgi:hypothetical protein